MVQFVLGCVGTGYVIYYTICALPSGFPVSVWCTEVHTISIRLPKGKPSTRKIEHRFWRRDEEVDTVWPDSITSMQLLVQIKPIGRERERERKRGRGASLQDCIVTNLCHAMQDSDYSNSSRQLRPGHRCTTSHLTQIHHFTLTRLSHDL